jgi:outer membrane lipoprotein-sorting protein
MKINYLLILVVLVLVLLGCTQQQLTESQIVAQKSIDSLNGIKTISFFESSVTSELIDKNKPNTRSFTFNSKVNDIDFANKKAHIVTMIMSRDGNIQKSITEDAYIDGANKYTKTTVVPNLANTVSDWKKTESNIVLDKFVTDTASILKDYNLVSMIDGNVGSTDAYILTLNKFEGENKINAQVYVSKENYKPLRVSTDKLTPLGVSLIKTNTDVKSYDMNTLIVVPSKALQN